MNNKIFYFLIPFGIVLVFADTILFYQIIGITSVYISVLFIAVVLIGYIIYGTKNTNKTRYPVKFKEYKPISIKPVDESKIKLFKKILTIEIILIVILLARIFFSL